MLEAERVAQRVHAFLYRAIEEHHGIGRLTIKFRPEPECRHDRDPIGFTCVAEDETVRRLVQIATHDAEQYSVAMRIRRQHAIEYRVEKVLAARRVGERGREGERLFDCELMEKSFFEARCKTLAKVGANAIDWNQADLLHILYLLPSMFKSFARRMCRE